MKIKLASAFLPILLATGCASPVWSHKDGSQSNSKLQYDHQSCDSYSRGATPMPSNNPTSYEARVGCVGAYCNVTVQESHISANTRNIAGIITLFARQGKYENCMNNMGWYEVD
jgi:hypothetical protein